MEAWYSYTLYHCDPWAIKEKLFSESSLIKHRRLPFTAFAGQFESAQVHAGYVCINTSELSFIRSCSPTSLTILVGTMYALFILYAHVLGVMLSRLVFYSQAD